MTTEAHRFPTLWDVATDLAETRPRDPAVVCGDTRLSYAALADRSARIAAVLAARGVRTGDRVVWLGQNCHHIFELLLAASRLGAMLAPLNWRLTTDELASTLTDLDPSVVVWQGIDGVDRDVLARTGRAEWIDDTPGDSRYEDLVSAVDAEVAAAHVQETTGDAQSPVLVLYTAAFSGRPNGSMLTSSNLLTQGLVLGSLMQLDRRFTYLDCGPLFHIATMMVAVATLEHGGVNVVVPRVDVELMCRVIKEERCTSGFVLPQVAEDLARHAVEVDADLSSFRSPLDLPVWRDLVRPDETPWGRSSNGYGQTELSGNVAHGALLGEGPLPLGIGLAAPLTRLAVRRDDGTVTSAPGSTGEVLVRGPLVHHGYWNRPEINAERLRDGWWHTGDLGTFGEDGRLVFLGPMARLIKTGLENVYPAEVEGAIRDLDGVLEVGVIGVPDEKWGQSIRAVVRRTDGATLTEDDVVRHTLSRIASYKKPRSVVFVDAPLPRTGGPVDYDRLDRDHGGGGYPSSTHAAR
ncbi:AMP-binding protein [Rhodococcus sp. 2H158]